jgi:hypothetical protein
LNDTDDTVRTGVILKSQESGKPHTLAAFHKYKERTELIIGISGRSGLTSLRGKIISENVMRTGGHDIYVYAVIPSEALSLSSPKESPYSPIRDAAKEFIPQR